jgi:hypothetical protein
LKDDVTKTDTRFKPGRSGNPEGRRRGSGKVGLIREALLAAWDGKQEDGGDSIREILIAKARNGDAWAVRLVAERVCPPVKPIESVVEVALTGETLTEKAGCVLEALSEGTLAPSQAAQLLQAIGSLAKVIEVDEVLKRLAALEAKANER